jgi:hypothetical protein
MVRTATKKISARRNFNYKKFIWSQSIESGWMLKRSRLTKGQLVGR